MQPGARSSLQIVSKKCRRGNGCSVPLVHYDLGCELVVVVVTLSYLSWEHLCRACQRCVCVCVCVLKEKEDMFLCLHSYTYCRHMCSPCISCLRFHVSMWRRLIWGGCILAYLYIGSRDAGGRGWGVVVVPRSPSPSSTTSAGCGHALFLPALRFSKTDSTPP